MLDSPRDQDISREVPKGQLPIPYYPISQFYKGKFGQKVFKVPVALSGDCPNRKGINGMKTCIFCDEHGSFAYPNSQKESLRSQIEMHCEKVSARFKSKKFLIYFQSYTTTFTEVQRLEEAFEIAMEYEDAVGFVVGTRPDCLSEKLFDVFNRYSEKTFVGVELGVQSFDNVQLEWMRRGHSSEQATRGVRRLQKNCPDVNVGVHLMFGWPGETDKDILNSAEICNSLSVDNVKLHNLHVLKNTPLEDFYNEGTFKPIEREEYCRRVGMFLESLHPDIAVHRLVAIASRWDELVAPEWTRYKMTNYQYALSYLREHEISQGKRFHGTL